MFSRPFAKDVYKESIQMLVTAVDLNIFVIK
jgi:hypothetical protein